ncbi:B3 domain-containing protein REM20-like [Salvia splendens]|uniref:B3 domain-containing protein REM20-like n=1 Tax=Salvia splendens TaxID=180675 RepID=UPI001C27A43A|nr:B3 domain-containing protein REM20-like [Salvia splendens]
MPIGIEWTISLLWVANGTRFHMGWPEFVRDNLFKHEVFLTVTLVDVGIFNVKRYDFRTGLPPRWDGEDIANGDTDDSPTAPDVDSSDDYQPSETETDSFDNSEYEDDQGLYGNF